MTKRFGFFLFGTIFTAAGFWGLCILADHALSPASTSATSVVSTHPRVLTEELVSSIRRIVLAGGKRSANGVYAYSFKGPKDYTLLADPSESRLEFDSLGDNVHTYIVVLSSGEMVFAFHKNSGAKVIENDVYGGPMGTSDSIPGAENEKTYTQEVDTLIDALADHLKEQHQKMVMEHAGDVEV